MSHECPDCGKLCYCDDEDCFNSTIDASDKCLHWKTKECESVQEDNDDLFEV